MTAAQITLARHALGLPNDSRRSYRNRYIVYGGHYEWNAMVDNGHAYIEKTYSKQIKWYALTRAGALAAIYPGETIEPEDLPEINCGL